MNNNYPLDVSLSNIWRSWYLFSQGKRKTRELELFRYNLETNLFRLYTDIANNRYKHGQYKVFIVCENKKREIRVAPIRDRVVHRLLYNYLVDIYDASFIYDIWSCRANKGLIGAIKRAQKLLSRNPRGFVWRADIRKFFDNIDHQTLWRIIKRKITDKYALRLLREVINSYSNVARSSLSLSLSRIARAMGCQLAT